ncbi:MAG: 2'-5' RNA ligase family protein [Thermomicrobiales bacterium]
MGSEQSIQSDYRRVWEAFGRASSTADGRHDTPRWRGASGPYAICMIRVPAPALQPALDSVRGAIAGLPEVRLHPDHFLHITLQELGFVVEHPSRPDEISASRLEEFAQSAIEPVTNARPFEITLGPVNAFEDAIFLEVGGGSRVGKLHSRLFELAAIPQEPAFAFLPHCTLAHFTGAMSPTAAAAALQPFRSEPLGRIQVTEVEIVTMEASEAYPEMENFAVIPLGA